MYHYVSTYYVTYHTLPSSVDNSAVFDPPQPIFEQPCMSHVLQGACKVAEIDVTSKGEGQDDIILKVDGI